MQNLIWLLATIAQVDWPTEAEMATTTCPWLHIQTPTFKWQKYYEWAKFLNLKLFKAQVAWSLNPYMRESWIVDSRFWFKFLILVVIFLTCKFFRSCNCESLFHLRPWCSMDHYLLNDHLVVWSWTSTFMVVCMCNVVSWISEAITQALMNLCVHYLMFNLMSFLTQHSLFALSSSIIHLLTQRSRVSFIFTFKFLNVSVFWVKCSFPNMGLLTLKN
jgi:hypothetical protein